MYILRKYLRTIIQYQTVRYDTLPLSPISRNRLNAVKRKILVLDLDETLIHSHHDGVLRPTVRPGTPPDFILKVVIDKHPVRFFVHKRPHVDFFLEVVSQWYELVVFTASMEIYGSAVADKLDNNRNILKRRYYRQVLFSSVYVRHAGHVGAWKSWLGFRTASLQIHPHPQCLKGLTHESTRTSVGRKWQFITEE